MGKTTVGQVMEEIRDAKAAETAPEEKERGQVTWACVIRRNDGKYLEGCGYGGPGNPVPYWTDDVRMAKRYKMPEGTREAVRKFGGHRGVVEIDGKDVKWLGFMLYWRGCYRIITDPPRDFDPHDYEGNNGPIG